MAKDIKLSATRINTFLSCKQKYFYNYYDKLPKVENTSFKLGLAVHESLELAGQILMKKKEESPVLTKEEVASVLKKYNEVSVREGIDDQEINLEGRELVKKRLSNFMSGMKIIGTETRFGFDDKDIVTDLGVPLIGAIDKVELINKDTILIVDYKTSKTAPTPSQLKTDIQLSMYDLVARKLFPKYNRVVLALDLLKTEMFFTYRTDAQRHEFELYLKEIYDQMVTFTKKEAKASLNMFCPWCDFRDYCSTYQEACKKSDYKFLPVMNYTNGQLIDEWESVKSTKKILEGRERELGLIIMEKIKTTSENLKGGATEVYIRQNSSTNYDLDTVYKLIPTEDFAGLVSLNKKAIDNYVEMNPSIKEMLIGATTTNFTSPFLATRKSKK